MTSLEVKEDGQIWLWTDRPAEPNWGECADDSAMPNYYEALNSAERYLVSNQEVAVNEIWYEYCKTVTTLVNYRYWKETLLKPGIYPIPDLQWEVMTWSKTVGFKESKFQPGFLPVVEHQKVAVISLPESKSEQKKLLIEMMQEDEKNGMYEKSDNELIAEFMGVREQTGYYDSYGSNAPYWFTEIELFRSRSFTVPDRSFFEFLEHCKYDTSWDWLMPVVEKIAKIETNDIIHNGEDSYFDSYFPRTFGMINAESKEFMVRINRSPLHQSTSLIEATYKAVVQFIKWYNQQSK